MSDLRDARFSGRIAHVSRRGHVEAEGFADGEPCAVVAPVTPLCRGPAGPRERELLWGQGFLRLDRRDGWSYGFATRDGYCGWIADGALGPPREATHVVAVRETYGKATADLKTTEPTTPLFLGSEVIVESDAGPWWRIADGLHVPRQHLRPKGRPQTDPVAVALAFLGTPYLWGGNSGRGIDCSGLVQAAMLACGIDCPGDADQQEERLGAPLAPDAPRRPGDLWFWPGHVGLLLDADRLLHANAHAMAVTVEPLEAAVARIAASEGAGVGSRRRVSPPGG